MDEALRELARLTTELRRLERAEAKTIANVTARYEQRRVIARAALSPTAARLFAAMQKEEQDARRVPRRVEE